MTRMAPAISRRAFLAAAGMLAGSVRAARAQAPGALRLFDGTLAGWTIEGGAEGIAVRDGLLRVEGPRGWLRSVAQYGDMDLHVEWRFVTADADSGIFFRAPSPPDVTFARGWPANAYQVQVRDMSRNRTTSPYWIANLYRHRVPEGPTEYDGDAALRAVKGPGEWQALDIEVRGDTVRAALNGTPVLRASGIVNPRGHIGIQAETGVLEYRSLDLLER
jgi:hypothetical protein